MSTADLPVDDPMLVRHLCIIIAYYNESAVKTKPGSVDVSGFELKLLSFHLFSVQIAKMILVI